MKVRVKFRKEGAMKFIGHLDVMRYFQKAIRRAEIDIQYSKGYNPRQEMSFASPLGVGLTSDSEYVDLILGECGSSKEMIDRLNAVMVEGFTVCKFNQVKDETKNAMSIVAAADYLVSLKDGYSICDREGFDFKQEFDAFMNMEEIVILKKSKKSERMVNIKPWIYSYSFDMDKIYENSICDRYENGNAVMMKLSGGSVNNLKPELVMEAFCNHLQVEFNPFAWQLHRLEVYENLKPVGEDEPVDLTTFVPLDSETTEMM